MAAHLQTPGVQGLPATHSAIGMMALMVGTPFEDQLEGRSGNDVIDGDDGHDHIRGSNGNDLLLGGDGNDRIEGGNGEDALFGEEGDDQLYGGNGRDVLRGGNGNDVLMGGRDQDFLSGGSGDDLLDGGDGDDLLRGGSGNDILRGGNGRDRLDGGEGNDALRGRDGADLLSGGSGNDIIDGDEGNDLLSGGDGIDTMRAGNGHDVVDGGEGNDVILGEAGNDAIQGGEGNDVIDGDGALTILGLTQQNTLISIDPSDPSQTRTVRITGVDGTLIGMDVRPRDGQIYGVTTTNKIYTINPQTGDATFVSALTTPFNSGPLSGVDFNPVPDRLRVVGANGQNFRINVDTGEVATLPPNPVGDTPLAYAPGDLNAGVTPTINAIAYTNSLPPVFGPVQTTTLFGIDTNLDRLVRQGGANSTDPSPNTGQLFTIGRLGVDFDANTGFDIFTAPNGVQVGVAVSRSKLYIIDLETGAARDVGTVGNGSVQFVSVVNTLDPSAVGHDTLLGGAGNDVINGGKGNDTVSGEDGNDSLAGDIGRDNLTGGAGNDVLTGGKGDDVLTGGVDADRFVFGSNVPFSAADLGVDRITDFQVGIDKIVLSQATFGVITPDQIAITTSDRLAATSSGLITYSTATGHLFFNANGAEAGFGAGGPFARLVGSPTITRDDVVSAA